MTATSHAEEAKAVLEQFGISVVDGQPFDPEVPVRFHGTLGDFTFVISWAYWRVKGPVPLAVAWELYRSPLGKHIRIHGNIGCPAPGEVENSKPVWRHRTTKKILVNPERWDSYKSLPAEVMNEYQGSKDIEAEGDAFIESYHIDTDEALEFFVATLKRHQLV